MMLTSENTAKQLVTLSRTRGHCTVRLADAGLWGSQDNAHRCYQIGDAERDGVTVLGRWTVPLPACRLLSRWERVQRLVERALQLFGFDFVIVIAPDFIAIGR